MIKKTADKIPAIAINNKAKIGPAAVKSDPATRRIIGRAKSWPPIIKGQTAIIKTLIALLIKKSNLARWPAAQLLARSGNNKPMIKKGRLVRTSITL